MTVTGGQSNWWQSEWIWTSVGWLGWALAAVGFLLILRALFRDRSRGRRRCPGCWYDMTGLPAADPSAPDRYTCPECGRSISHTRALHRTRRHWRAASLALLLLFLGLGALASIRYRAGGWERIIPGTLLAMAAPMEDPQNVLNAFMGANMVGMTSTPVLNKSILLGPNPPALSTAARLSLLPTTSPTWRKCLSDESWRRLQAGEFWGWQARWFVDRALDEYSGGAKSCVSCPSRWIADQSIPVLLSGRTTLQGWFLDLQPSSNAELAYGLDKDNMVFLPASASAAKHAVRLDLEVLSGSRSLYSSTYRSSVVIVPDARSFFRFDDSFNTTERVQAALDPRLSIFLEDATLMLGSANNTNAPLPYIGAQIEIRIDGVLAARGVYRPFSRYIICSGMEMDVSWFPGMKARAAKAPDKVRVRLTGDPEASWTTYSQFPFNNPDPTCWTGSFEMTPRVESP